MITGLLVAGATATPVVYVSSSDPRVGGGVNGTETNLDTNSGVVSRLTKSGTGWQKQDLVRGLPRSQENHATNALVLDQEGNALYIAQGGNTNMGAPSHNFTFLPECQAKVTTSGPVQVYAPGFRNPFALVKARSGNLYAVDNGSNAGWGNVPVGAGPGGTCTNAVNESGIDGAHTLHRITGPGYCGGHVNPTRGNRANTFNVTNPQSPVPIGNGRVPGGELREPDERQSTRSQLLRNPLASQAQR
jgi:hypothetical protein